MCLFTSFHGDGVERRQIPVLLFFLGLCLGVGGLGAWVTVPEIGSWYEALSKPSWTPPDQIFGPVWTSLYVMMAVSAWLVWRERSSGARTYGLYMFFVQLILNVGWSWLFFRFHWVGAAFVEVVLLILAIGIYLVVVARVSRLGAVLFLPYLAWVLFASALNFRIWQLNYT